jgi:hypothetical protein
MRESVGWRGLCALGGRHPSSGRKKDGGGGDEVCACVVRGWVVCQWTVGVDHNLNRWQTMLDMGSYHRW